MQIGKCGEFETEDDLRPTSMMADLSLDYDKNVAGCLLDHIQEKYDPAQCATLYTVTGLQNVPFPDILCIRLPPNGMMKIKFFLLGGLGRF